MTCPGSDITKQKTNGVGKCTTNEGENILHYTGIQVSFGVFSYVAFTIDISNKVSKFHMNDVM